MEMPLNWIWVGVALLGLATSGIVVGNVGLRATAALVALFAACFSAMLALAAARPILLDRFFDMVVVRLPAGDALVLRLTALLIVGGASVGGMVLAWTCGVAMGRWARWGSAAEPH